MSERYFQLVEEASQLPTSPNKTAILEDAVREADSLDNGWLSFDARERLIENTVFSGEIEKAIVAFTWCISKYDAEEEFARQDPFGLMWAYRWIVASITAFPFMSREKIHEMEDDIIERFQTEGFGVRSLYIRRWANARDMGDTQRMEESREEWVRHSFDRQIECYACDMQSEVSFCLYHDKVDLAQIWVHKIIQDTSVRCNRVPLSSYAAMLEPLLTVDVDMADEFAQIGETFMGDTSETLADAGRFITFYLQRGQIDRAVTMFESHAALGLSTSEMDLFLDFVVASENLMRVLGSDRRPTLPTSIRDVENLEVYFAQKTDETAAAFDKRNGNTVVSDRVNRQRARVG